MQGNMNFILEERQAVNLFSPSIRACNLCFSVLLRDSDTLLASLIQVVLINVIDQPTFLNQNDTYLCRPNLKTSSKRGLRFLMGTLCFSNEDIVMSLTHSAVAKERVQMNPSSDGVKRE
jgi:hypothetical protein